MKFIKKTNFNFMGISKVMALFSICLIKDEKRIKILAVRQDKREG